MVIFSEESLWSELRGLRGGPLPGFRDIWMSEGASSSTVDIDSLSRAVAQLHLATGNLAQALERPASPDGWVVVNDTPGTPPRTVCICALLWGLLCETDFVDATPKLEVRWATCPEAPLSATASPPKGGFLLALPVGAVPPNLLAQGNEADPSAMFGPSTTLTVPAVVEEEDGGEVPAGLALEVLVVDFSESACEFLEPYDPLLLIDRVLLPRTPQAHFRKVPSSQSKETWTRVSPGGASALTEKQEAFEQKVSMGIPATASAWGIWASEKPASGQMESVSFRKARAVVAQVGGHNGANALYWEKVNLRGSRLSSSRLFGAASESSAWSFSRFALAREESPAEEGPEAKSPDASEAWMRQGQREQGLGRRLMRWFHARGLPSKGALNYLYAGLRPVCQGLTSLGPSFDRYGANWDPSDFLDDLFYMPFREPQVLLLPGVGPPGAYEVPDISREVPSRVLALAKLWDSFGLLRLSRDGPETQDQAVRVFNAAKNRATDRQIGDRIGVADRKDFYHQLQEVFACFGAILQGDALGVEFACSCHSNLLSAYGLLGADSRLQGGSPFPCGAEQDLIEGLVIDDWFAVACQPVGEQGSSAAGAAFARAQKAYSETGLFGSPKKDIYEATCATIAGAEVDSSEATRQLGLALVGPAKEKHIALAALSLEAARLPRTSDSLHLSLTGAWVSACLFRRPFMSVLDRVFRLVDVAGVSPESPKAYPLPRRTANEFVVLSALSFVLTCDVSAPWSSTLFATDSSSGKGSRRRGR
ncbi:unnamed protein product, partial [Symbiodinium necroappetens]